MSANSVLPRATWVPCITCSQGDGFFWGFLLQFNPNTILVVGDAITRSTICFMVFGVWLNVNIIQCIYTLFTTIAHHEVWVLVEFGLC
jgi:hypothetical protein